MLFCRGGGGPGCYKGPEGVRPDGWQHVSSTVFVEGRLVSPDVNGLLDPTVEPIGVSVQDTDVIQ